MTETIGRFHSESTAQDFVETVRQNLASCPKKNLAAQVDQETTDHQDSVDSSSWRVRLDLSDGTQARYRTSIIRNGTAVAQVTFTAADSYDISQEKFHKLVKRAGQRLTYAN